MGQISSITEFTHDDGKVTVTVSDEEGNAASRTYDPYYESERESAHQEATEEVLRR